nr:MAG TPA: hypothetical protein [Caudoviricetes sp.]
MKHYLAEQQDGRQKLWTTSRCFTICINLS